MRKTSRIFLAIFVAFFALLTAMPAFASDYTLGIFGNANMDDRIDEADVAYIEGVIAASNKPTLLSDTNGDGSVNQKDVEQVQKIIKGSEEQLILIDDANRTVRIDMPIKSVVPLVDRDAKTLGVLDAEDMAVAVSSNIKESKEYQIILPQLARLSSVGSWTDVNGGVKLSNYGGIKLTT